MTVQRIVRVAAYAVAVRDGAILLCHQVADGLACGQWTLPGGGIEFGEDPAAAALRECREETGLTPVIGNVLDVYSNTRVAAGTGVEWHGIRLLFEAVFDTDERPEPVSPNDTEIDAVGWFPVNGLPEPITDWARLAAGRS